MSDYKIEMGQRIKSKRKELNLTQEVVAERLSISVKHFSEVERGISGLSIENLIKLSNLLGVSIDYIIKGKIDNCKWNTTIEELQNIPTEKEKLLKELIHLGIKLAQ